MLNQREMQLIKLFYNKINFTRISLSEKQGQPEVKIEQKVETNKENNQIYKITLSMLCEKKEEYSIEIELCGLFLIVASNDDEISIYLNNAIAIMMPYLRNQLTILTSQPDMKPIVMPVINFKNNDSKDEG